MSGNTRTIFKFTLFLRILQLARCSVVVDSFGQEGIHVSDYCPRTDFCPEGSHVMCMYYDPNRVMNPRCGDPQNVTVTAPLASQILDITNGFRSRVAHGNETGADGQRLPRGFGLFRLKWDNELATFAQVLANQCLVKLDLCRGSKRFPNPEQLIGAVRFSYPDWKPFSNKNKVTAPGLDDSKLAYAVKETLRVLYLTKRRVTEDYIKSYPKTFTTTQNSGPSIYLSLVQGSATHIGCGLSAYTSYSYTNEFATNRNVVQLVCNISTRPKPGEIVYATTPSVDSSTCGCPRGTYEDSDWLCNGPLKGRKKLHSVRVQSDPESCAGPEKDYEPTMVLLPILSVEDAPPDVLNGRSKALGNYTSMFDPTKGSAFIRTHDPKSARIQGQKRQSLATMNKKPSIFSRGAQFKLPNTRKAWTRYESIKQDVKPRKNFKNIQKVVNDYIKQRNTQTGFKNKLITNKQQDQMTKESLTKLPTETKMPEPILNNAEQNVITLNQHLKQKNNNSIEDNSKYFDVKYDENDNKLMTLLDSLEQEVKHIELDGDEKQIFDAKIRKIYHSVVRKPPEVLTVIEPDSKNRLQLRSQSYILSSSQRAHQENNLLNSQPEETKAYANHAIENNHRSQHDPSFLADEMYHHNAENRIKNYEDFNHNHNKVDEVKYSEGHDSEYLHDNGMSDFDDKGFSDIEQKYNKRLKSMYAKNNLEQRYREKQESNFVDHYKVRNNNIRGNMPDLRNQNSVVENRRRKMNSNEVLKRRHFDLHHDEHNGIESNRNHLRNNRNIDDMRKNRKVFLIRDKSLDSYKESERENVLSDDRRKYYQEELDNVKMKLKQRRKHKNREIRRIRPNIEESDRSRSKIRRSDSIYMPDRARFLHGF